MTADLLQELQTRLGADLTAFLPELVLCGGIVLMLFIRLFTRFDRRHLGWVAMVVVFYALFVSFNQFFGLGYTPPKKSMDMFSGLLVYDNFTIFLRIFLLGFTFLVIWLSILTGIPDREDSADFYCLLLGATLGMSLMASANHLLMIFIGVEMASLPSYALAGFLKGRRQSSEAALKYVVYGGGSAGIMLYGISLLAGKYGTGYIPDLALFLSHGTLDPIVLLGILFILIGVAFKLAAVPFHFWCPDVFEGAAAEVGAFLSVASKGAALALLARFVLNLGGLTQWDALVRNVAWTQVTPFLVPALAIIAAVTTTFGNLAAYAQTNLKRLLAYSTIAHAGFMMMGIAAMTRAGVGAVMFYLVAYLFMNLGAFAVVAFLRNVTGSEDLKDFRGLIQRAPVLVVTLAICLLSLLGLPPLAGFVAKFQIFTVLFNAGQIYSIAGQPELSMMMYGLLVVGGVNTAISLVYYVKVIKVMILDKPLEEVEGRTPKPYRIESGPRIYMTLIAAVIVALGVFWGSAYRISSKMSVDPFQEIRVANQASRIPNNGGQP